MNLYNNQIPINKFYLFGETIFVSALPPELPHQVLQVFNQICSTKSGSSFLAALQNELKSKNFKLLINEGSNNTNKINDFIFVQTSLSSNIFTIYENSEGERHLRVASFQRALTHELIHALHYAMLPPAIMDARAAQISLQWSNEEERITTEEGIFSENNICNSNGDTLKRISHLGYTVKDNLFLHVIALGADGDLEKINSGATLHKATLAYLSYPSDFSTKDYPFTTKDYAFIEQVTAHKIRTFSLFLSQHYKPDVQEQKQINALLKQKNEQLEEAQAYSQCNDNTEVFMKNQVAKLINSAANLLKRLETQTEDSDSMDTTQAEDSDSMDTTKV